MPRVLVILPTTTYRAADFVEAAQGLGVDLAIASEDPPPFDLGDRFVRIDCSRPETAAESLADLAATTPIDAIVPADDQGVVIAALAAERIGLPHNPPASAAATRNKVMMRRALERAEVPQPSFRVASPGDDPAEVAAAIGYPVVFKPLSLSASRGVIRADDDRAAKDAAARIRAILGAAGQNPNEPLLVERFMSGPEVAVEGMMWDGDLEVLAVMDKPDPLEGPYFEETILITPSRLHPEVVEEVEAVTARAVRALGLRQGPVHAEVRVTGSQVRILEVAARTIGGLCGRSLRFGLMRTSLETLVLRQALGMRKRGMHREPGAAGVMMLPIPRAGTLEGVEGQAEALAVEGITGLEITIPIGGRVVPLPEGDRYLGFLFAGADSPDRVESALREAHRRLRILVG